MKVIHFLVDLGFFYLYIIINNVLLTVTLRHSDKLRSWRFLHSPKKTQRRENKKKEQINGWLNYVVNFYKYFAIIIVKCKL